MKFLNQIKSFNQNIIIEPVVHYDLKNKKVEHSAL